MIYKIKKFIKNLNHKHKHKPTQKPKEIFIIEYNKVLIVDDDIINRYVLNRYIKQVDFNIIIDEAANGIDAINLSKKTNYRFIFMDIRMAFMDGIEASRIILQNKPETIIYGITGQMEAISVNKAIQVGIKKCLGKPIDKKDIQDLFT